MVGVVAIEPERDVYANLLRDSRGLPRAQSSARDHWYAALPGDRKEATLFELEMLLKGLACFGNPRNHPGPTRRSEVAHDFRPELLILRDVMGQVNSLVRQLLGSREREYTFTRYLESVLPEDAARDRLLQDQLTQDTPEESLLVLRSAFGSLSVMADGLLRLNVVTHRVYYALHGSLTREVGRNAFFNPLIALEFRPEFDRIRSPEALDILHGVRDEGAHRILALAMLTLFRALRYVDLIDRYVTDPTSARRAYPLFAVLRSDLRTLTRYLGERASSVLADGFERELMTIHAVELPNRRPGLERHAAWLSGLRTGLETVANALRIDVRKAFLHDLAAPSDEVEPRDLAPRFLDASAALRASIHHAVRELCEVAAPGQPAPALRLNARGRRAAAERTRREVWMFMQVVRAFRAKAENVQAHGDRWNGGGSLGFVRDFLHHFRALGERILRVHPYREEKALRDALDGLRDIDLIEPARLTTALEACGGLYAYLEALFERVGQRSELTGQDFDRRDATEALKIYLGRA